MFSIRVPVYDSFGGAVPGQPGGGSTFRWDRIDGVAAVIIRRKGDGMTIGRELGKYFYSRRGAEMLGFASFLWYHPEIVGIGENDLGGGDIRESQQGCIDLCAGCQGYRDEGNKG